MAETKGTRAPFAPASQKENTIMAIFDASPIVEDKEKGEHTFDIDLWELPEGTDTPTLTVTVNDSVIETAKKADKKTNDVRVFYKKEYAKIDNNPANYANAILAKAYKDSSGLHDEPTKQKVMDDVRGDDNFARYVAGLFTTYFGSKTALKVKQEKEDEKN